MVLPIQFPVCCFFPVVRLLNKVLFLHWDFLQGRSQDSDPVWLLAASCFLLSADLDVSAVCFTDSDHSSADLVGEQHPISLSQHILPVYFQRDLYQETASDAAGRGKAADPCFFTRFYIVQTKRGSHKNITCLGSYLYLLYDTKGQKVKNPMQAVKIAGKLKKDGL